MIYRFGAFLADRTAYRVTRDGQPVDLTPKLLDLLFHFLERPATLVTKEDLLGAVWPGANVTDNALAQAISELREAIGDRASAPDYIRTVARRGYRFVALVQEAPDATTTTAASAPDHASDAHDATRALVVMDFDNVTGDADIAWLSAGIAETVTSDLASLGPFTVIDRWSVIQTGRRTDGSMQALGVALGARLVVIGSFQRADSSLRITARVVDLSTGESVADVKVDGPMESVFALQDAVAASFARELLPQIRQAFSVVAPRQAGVETP